MKDSRETAPRPDSLDDLCPICGEPIEEGQPWTLIDGQMIHESCEPAARET